MKIVQAVGLLLLLLSCVYATKMQINDEDSSKYVGPHLDVHIIAHTHDDVGWLKTVDEYFYGANQSIQDAGVQYILDNVITALQDNPDRKFIYVEIAFFSRWWAQQDDYKQQIVRDLVTEGRLEFINGGWCMNDEANTDYESIIDQMTQGHLWLFNEFGVRPRIGWHIDPFGHANTQASLFAQMGFDAFFFGRIDYQDHDIRNQTQQLEFVWRGSNSLGENVDIFAHVLYTDYCFLSGFGWEWGADPIQDDPRLFNVNIKERCDDYASQVRARSTSFRTNHVMIPFGCDFQFENALMEFKNMDKIIKYINSHQSDYNMTLKYSTPSIYVDEVHNEGLTWELNQYDFMPYADNEHSYWSGYFTSRPALKGYVRSTGGLLRASDKLFTAASAIIPNINVAENLVKIDTLSEAYSVAQHHDAVAGTEQQHVAYDYAMRLSIGTAATQEVINDVFGMLLGSKDNVPQFTFCPLMNESNCPATNLLSSGYAVPIALFNPIGWARTYHLRVPIPISNVQVLNVSGDIIQAQIVPNEDFPNMYTIIFAADLPPLGYAVYSLQPSSNKKLLHKNLAKVVENPTANTVLENEFLAVTFSSGTGRLMSITNKEIGQTVQVSQDFFWYNGSTGNNVLSEQTSGAYIFRPNSSYSFPVLSSGNPAITFIDGDVVQEVRQVWNSTWAVQTVRLYAGARHIEFESTIGPIPIWDGLGKEVITRFSTNLNTQSTWWTDSEGQEMQMRMLNWRPTWNYVVNETVASNYYPMNFAAFIRDNSEQTQFTLITDRSRGVSSLNNGQLENMLHRRLLVDDSRGVGEPLNESDTIRTCELVAFDSIQNSSTLLRTFTLLHNNPPIVAFTSTKNLPQWMSNRRLNYTALSTDLPPNVHINNLKTLDDGFVLLRLNHIYATGEDPILSKPATVDVSTLFSDYSVSSLQEMTLSGNRPLSQLHRLKWKISSQQSQSPKLGPKSFNDFVITLNPMQIRTFMVRLQPK